MDQLADFMTLVIGHAITPFLYVTASAQRIYWLYLLVALLLAIWVYARKKDGGTAHLAHPVKSFLRYCFPKEVYLHASAKVDYLYFIINRILVPWMVAPLVIGTALVSEASAPLFAQFGALDGLMGEAGLGDRIAYTLATLLAMDAALYIGHYLQHRVPILWEFHKVHHSAEVLTPITVYRMHPVDDLLNGSLAGILMGLVMGLFQILYSDGLGIIEVAGLNAGVFAFYILGYNLRHSHIWLAYSQAVSHIFISPAQHQIHHSIHPKHYDRNFGFIFAFWDWFGGTLYVPKEEEQIEFGIMGEDPAEYTSVWRLYWRPFVRAYRRLNRLMVKRQS